jgi:hypothetical protein
MLQEKCDSLSRQNEEYLLKRVLLFYDKNPDIWMDAGIITVLA